MTESDLPHCPRLVWHALRPLPTLPLGLALTALSRRLSARHSGMLRRLGDYAEHAVLIDLTDLPFVLRMEPAAGPRITAHRRGRAPAAAARIAGPLSALTGMLHGRYDGDALFFSRDLVIEGDTSVVLALRNALDDAELDLAEELATLAGPFGGGPTRGRAGRTRQRVEHASRRPGQGRSDERGPVMMELVCPAGTPAALRAAVGAGAHTIYCGFADETNARNFPGLNFSREELADAVVHAHARGAKVLVAINTFPRAGAEPLWHRAVADAETAGADAVILADPGLLARAAYRHPALRRHLSVQAAAANPDAINFYAEAFGVRRVVLPRVLTVAEITAINREIDVETEVFVFGGLCVMAEGRCSLSSYATGRSPNMNGVCSPASHVVYSEESDGLRAALGGFTIHRTPPGRPAPYPTLCKGCFTSGEQTGHVFEDPVSLDATQLIPALARAGVSALKIEGGSGRAPMWPRWCALSEPRSRPRRRAGRCRKACWPA